MPDTSPARVGAVTAADQLHRAAELYSQAIEHLVAECREDRDYINLKAVAIRAGVSEATLRNWMAGRTPRANQIHTREGNPDNGRA
jgi:hypothetical protein